MEQVCWLAERGRKKSGLAIDNLDLIQSPNKSTKPFVIWKYKLSNHCCLAVFSPLTLAQKWRFWLFALRRTSPGDWKSALGKMVFSFALHFGSKSCFTSKLQICSDTHKQQHYFMACGIYLFLMKNKCDVFLFHENRSLWHFRFWRNLMHELFCGLQLSTWSVSFYICSVPCVMNECFWCLFDLASFA